MAQSWAGTKAHTSTSAARHNAKSRPGLTFASRGVTNASARRAMRSCSSSKQTGVAVLGGSADVDAWVEFTGQPGI